MENVARNHTEAYWALAAISLAFVDLEMFQHYKHCSNAGDRFEQLY